MAVSELLHTVFPGDFEQQPPISWRVEEEEEEEEKEVKEDEEEEEEVVREEVSRITYCVNSEHASSGCMCLDKKK